MGNCVLAAYYFMGIGLSLKNGRDWGNCVLTADGVSGIG